MGNIKEALQRLQKVYKVSNNRKLSEAIGVNYNTLSTWIKRESIPYDFFNKLVQEESISFDWLLFGKEERHTLQANTTDSYSIPILSITASAGTTGNHLSSIDIFDTSKRLQVDKVLFKTPPTGTIKALQVDGYSMTPMLYPDSWVLFDETDVYIGDGLYIINWRDILMVKLLQVDLSTGHLRIISTNQAYDSWDIKPENQEVFLILGKVLRCII